MPCVLILSSLVILLRPLLCEGGGAEARDNETRHWNVDDYMVARREREGEREGARRVGSKEGRESEPKIAVEFVVPGAG